jgi:hydrogenase nickel incorporation protein HypA/HybF
VHELALSSAVVNTAVKHASGRPVRVVSLNVGTLRQVVPETLAFYFKFTSQGTLCDGARLEQNVIAARLRCADCGRVWEIDFPAFSCSACDPGDVSVISGDEFEVESIEVEEDSACIAQR